MALSFSLSPGLKPRRNAQGKIPVLVTGATGNIGSYYAGHHADEISLRLMVRKLSDKSKALEKGPGELVMGDLSDHASLAAAVDGIDTVIHLAGEASPQATWNSLLELNIQGTYNIMVAARAAGCRRLVYASSIHAISGHPADVQSKTAEAVNPGDLYGVTKCFGEALGRYMAEQEGLSVICLRIGGFQPAEAMANPGGISMMDAWVSQRDMAHMLDLSVLDETLRFGLFNGLSDNRFKRMDISDAREMLGYRPQDDFTEMNPTVKNLELDSTVISHSLGDDPSPDNSGIREELAGD